MGHSAVTEKIKSLESKLNFILAGKPKLEGILAGLASLNIPKGVDGERRAKLISKQRKTCSGYRIELGSLYQSQTNAYIFNYLGYFKGNGLPYDMIKKIHDAYPLPGACLSELLKDYKPASRREFFLRRGIADRREMLSYAVLEVSVPYFEMLMNLFGKRYNMGRFSPIIRQVRRTVSRPDRN